MNNEFIYSTTTRSLGEKNNIITFKKRIRRIGKIKI